MTELKKEDIVSYLMGSGRYVIIADKENPYQNPEMEDLFPSEGYDFVIIPENADQAGNRQIIHAKRQHLLRRDHQ